MAEDALPFLYTCTKITAKRYAEYGQVVVSRRGHESGPVDEALATLGLSRTVVAVVPSFRAALAVASASDLVALVTGSFFDATQGHGTGPAALRRFTLPVRTDSITISQMWHPRPRACELILDVPGHSHSIVSETFKLLFLLAERFRPPQLTVKSAVKNARLTTIDADRRRIEVLRQPGATDQQ